MLDVLRSSAVQFVMIYLTPSLSRKAQLRGVCPQLATIFRVAGSAASGFYGAGTSQKPHQPMAMLSVGGFQLLA
jgi:hypothetical protein